MNGWAYGRTFAQCGGSDESNAAVDGQTDDDGQVRHGAADGDRNRPDHVAAVVERRRLTGQQPLSHVSAYKTHQHTDVSTASTPSQLGHGIDQGDGNDISENIHFDRLSNDPSCT